MNDLPTNGQPCYKEDIVFISSTLSSTIFPKASSKAAQKLMNWHRRCRARCERPELPAVDSAEFVRDWRMASSDAEPTLCCVGARKGGERAALSPTVGTMAVAT